MNKAIAGKLKKWTAKYAAAMAQIDWLAALYRSAKNKIVNCAQLLWPPITQPENAILIISYQPPSFTTLLLIKDRLSSNAACNSKNDAEDDGEDKAKDKAEDDGENDGMDNAIENVARPSITRRYHYTFGALKSWLDPALPELSQLTQWLAKHAPTNQTLNLAAVISDELTDTVALHPPASLPPQQLHEWIKMQLHNHTADHAHQPSSNRHHREALLGNQCKRTGNRHHDNGYGYSYFPHHSGAILVSCAKHEATAWLPPIFERITRAKMFTNSSLQEIYHQTLKQPNKPQSATQLNSHQSATEGLAIQPLDVHNALRSPNLWQQYTLLDLTDEQLTLIHQHPHLARLTFLITNMHYEIL